MNFSKRWRIVPQLAAAFLIGAGSVMAALLPAPSIPETPEQADGFLQQRDDLERAGQEEALRREAQCHERTMVSNCLRKLDEDKAVYRRDLLTAQQAAKKILQQESVRQRELRQRPEPSRNKATGKPSTTDRADNSGTPDEPSHSVPPDNSQVPATQTHSQQDSATGLPAEPSRPASTASDPQNTGQSPQQQARQPKASKPGISEAEQAANRAAYEARQIEAEQRKAHNAQRQIELENRRAEYRRKQAELEARAAARAAARTDSKPKTGAP